MLDLIKKDIMLCRVGIFFIGVTSFLLGPISMFTIAVLSGDAKYTMVTLVYYLLLGLVLTATMVLDKETKVKGDMITYSLPIDRKLIVTARYISFILFPLVQSLAILLYSYIGKWTNGFWFMGNIDFDGGMGAINIFHLIFALSLIIFILSIYLYVYYTRRDKREGSLKTAFGWIYSFLVFLPIIIIEFWEKINRLKIVEHISGVSINIFIVVGFILSIIIYVVSMEMSKKRV